MAVASSHTPEADSKDEPAAHWPGVPVYNGLEVLSPMVRASDLPLRLSCLKYGAGLVYSGVRIDRTILETVRVRNESFDVTDFVSPADKRPLFSTCAEERDHLIFQLGTADGVLATQAALHVCRDVRGIDVNMGCMAPFTATGGMGAALLNKPEVAADIIRSLRSALPAACPVSCKIRMLPTIAQTLDFLQLVERSGADAVAIHLRTQEEGQAGNALQYTKAAHWSDASLLCQAVQIPVIANGDFLSRKRIDGFWAACAPDGDHSVGGTTECSTRGPAAIMIARGALWNPGIFHRPRPDDQGAVVDKPAYDDVVRNFVTTSLRTNNPYENTKWVLTEMLKAPATAEALGTFGGLTGRGLGKLKDQLSNAKSAAGVCKLFSLDYDEKAYSPAAHTLDFYKNFEHAAVQAF